LQAKQKRATGCKGAAEKVAGIVIDITLRRISMKTSLVKVITIIMALCLSLPSAAVMAQTSTTGTIEGVVTDAGGAVVPGVTVSVTSPNLIRSQSATTDNDGRYRIQNLPPGMYQVAVEAVKGFGRFERSDVEVNLSKTSTLEIQLRPQGAAESVTVTATSGDTIDATSNTTGTNVSSQQFSNFPTQRTVQSLYSIAPTVARSGLRDQSGRDRDPSVAGSSGPENNYILDGITTTDPAFGGSGANLPFEFVQEVEIKTGAFGAEYGKSTGGIFNVITKSGGNSFHGDLFTYFSTKSMVRETKNFPLTGSAPNGFSELDAGFDLGGPIIKDRLWFFGAFNPQRRKNFLFTQTFRDEVENKITTPFYAGKITYALSQNHTFTFSTFGDYTKLEGFIGGNGFGASPNTFLGTLETGGSNYAFRLNSSITPNWIGEFSFGLHLQRANTIPDASVADVPLITDTFAILKNGGIAPVVESNANFISGGINFGPVAFVSAPGGSLQRNFARQGFGLLSSQDRNRWEFAAKLSNIFGPHTFKYGFEFSRNNYDINTLSSGAAQTFGNPLGLTLINGSDVNQTNGIRTTNSFSVCTTRGNQIVCPVASIAARANLIANQAGFSGGAIVGAITANEVNNNPFLIRSSTRVRDFELVANTHTNIQSFYLQDEWKITPSLLVVGGVRWDFQQAYGDGGATYLKLDKFWYNLQPRVGVNWDFTGKGRGKFFANYAYYVETPIPLDINVRAGGGDTQTDKNFNVNRVNAPVGSTIVPGVSADATIGGVNLGADATPIDFDLKPQTVHEGTVGIEYGLMRDMVVGMRGIYRAQGHVIEDGSFDDGNTYFLFNPGESQTERLACANPAVGCFGRARRYYRALEFSATKRFANNYQFIASYVYSSLIGNYEGLFRNDNGQSDPNITSLFDLVSLLKNTYGRLPNDRPHQFKLDGSYRWPFKLLTSLSFRAQSGIPENELIPHPVYGNNEGFNVPRGSAGRTPTTTGLDFGAYYPIEFSETKQLRFQLDWFNVYNSQRAIRVDETLQINSGVTGVPPVDNPFFKTGTIFQFPSAVRLGVKFQF
jgi:outer membrane receptor protein involved in Fe transport